MTLLLLLNPTAVSASVNALSGGAAAAASSPVVSVNDTQSVLACIATASASPPTLAIGRTFYLIAGAATAGAATPTYSIDGGASSPPAFAEAGAGAPLVAVSDEVPSPACSAACGITQVGVVVIAPAASGLASATAASPSPVILLAPFASDARAEAEDPYFANDLWGYLLLARRALLSRQVQIEAELITAEAAFTAAVGDAAIALAQEILDTVSARLTYVNQAIDEVSRAIELSDMYAIAIGAS